MLKTQKSWKCLFFAMTSLLILGMSSSVLAITLDRILDDGNYKRKRTDLNIAKGEFKTGITKSLKELEKKKNAWDDKAVNTNTEYDNWGACYDKHGRGRLRDACIDEVDERVAEGASAARELMGAATTVRGKISAAIRTLKQRADRKKKNGKT